MFGHSGRVTVELDRSSLNVLETSAEAANPPRDGRTVG
jgi:hypothetical protein